MNLSLIRTLPFYLKHNQNWVEDEFFFDFRLPLSNYLNRQVPRDSMFSQVCRGEQTMEVSNVIVEEFGKTITIHNEMFNSILLKFYVYLSLLYDICAHAG